MKKIVVSFLLGILFTLAIGVVTIYGITHKDIILNKNSNNISDLLGIMIETDIDSNKYVLSEENKWPGLGYYFNPVLSNCENGSEIVWKNNRVVVNTKTSDKCYVYFDKVQVYDFRYTGDSQTFEVPKDGLYKIELWGAQGGGYNSLGGHGGYSSGLYNGKQGTKLYVYVGGQGATVVGKRMDVSGGWNGGGGGYSGVSGKYSTYVHGGGGGATDIANISSEMTYENYRYLRSAESYASRIIVAGGGGGAWAPVGAYDESEFSPGGYGGGLEGGSGYVRGVASPIPSGGTQTAGGLYNSEQTQSIGQFGYGGNEDTTSSIKCGVSGGGGGYYGGGGGNTCNSEYSAAGGSGYVGGVTSGNGVIAQTIAGNMEMPSPDGGTEIGHTGDGYARITLID